MTKKKATLPTPPGEAKPEPTVEPEVETVEVENPEPEAAPIEVVYGGAGDTIIVGDASYEVSHGTGGGGVKTTTGERFAAGEYTVAR